MKKNRERILNSYVWDMRVSYGELSENLKNPLPEMLDLQLAEIYQKSEAGEKNNHTLDFSSLEADLEEQISEIAISGIGRR